VTKLTFDHFKAIASLGRKPDSKRNSTYGLYQGIVFLSSNFISGSENGSISAIRFSFSLPNHRAINRDETFISMATAASAAEDSAQSLRT
jgi:hypothetical protein